jgi:hypothetical protein
LIDIALQRGNRLPEVIENQPELLPGLDFYYTPFGELSTCRHYGYGMCGPIPWDKIIAYADRLGLGGQEALRFTKMIRALDDTFLQWNRKKTSNGNAPEPTTDDAGICPSD